MNWLETAETAWRSWLYHTGNCREGALTSPSID